MQKNQNTYGNWIVSFFVFLGLFVSSLGFSQTQALSDHPDAAIFGDQSGSFSIGFNPQASLVIINPAFAGKDFGTFRMPTLAQFIGHDSIANKLVLERWARSNRFTEDAQVFFVPPETGRAVMEMPSTDVEFRDILNKGTGAFVKFTENNKLRTATLGFDGFFEVSEAVQDMLNAEILNAAGVLVVRGLGITDNNILQQRRDVTTRSGNYVRAFRVQTRVSNLAELTSEQRKAAIDHAIARLQLILHQPRPMTYVEYFNYMIDVCARAAAVYQAIGFTQDSFHFGQLTLAGELTDLGHGQWEKPTTYGTANTLHSWFRYERQPVLLQNMLYRTHSVKAEPDPIALRADSETFLKQDSLFGFLRSFDPQAASEIERSKPAERFWREYARVYQNYNIEGFHQNLATKFAELYNWTPGNTDLAGFTTAERAQILNRYQQLIATSSHGYDRPAGTYPWAPKGLASLHKQYLFAQAVLELRPNGSDLSTLVAGAQRHWPRVGLNLLANGHNDLAMDISWHPSQLQASGAVRRSSDKIVDLFNQARSGDLVVLDIDEVIMRYEGSGNDATMPIPGSDQWSHWRYAQILQEKTQSMPGAELSAIRRATLQQLEAEMPMHAKTAQARLVDSDLPNLIKQAESRGVKVIALTARGAGMIDVTLAQFAQLGVQMSDIAPNLNGQLVGRKAIYKNGAIFCSVESKGEVLRELLNKIGFLQASKDGKLSRVYFADDRIENIEKVESALQSREPKIDVFSLLYSAQQMSSGPLCSEILTN